MTEQILLKNKIGQIEVRELAAALAASWPEFAQQHFIEQASTGLDSLELKQRVAHLIHCLSQHLPADFNQTAYILINAGQQLAQEQNSGWSEFIAWPLLDYARDYGQHDLATATKVFEALTALFTAEFAVRPFVETQFKALFPYLLKWANSDDAHLRRLASEGIRPRLPWAGHIRHLQQDPKDILIVLERLKDDPSPYVQKSVANNLNDISKDHPYMVMVLCKKWLLDATPQRQWIIRHALRSLIKKGQPEVFVLLGYSKTVQLSGISLTADRSQLSLGETLSLQVTFSSATTTTQRFVLDYRMHYVLANGRTGSKVYKWKNITLSAGNSINLQKQHAFKPLSTRRFYPGLHKVELLLNGVVYDSTEVMLTV